MCTRAGVYFFFFNDTATTEIYTLSLHDALPICEVRRVQFARGGLRGFNVLGGFNQRNGALNDLGGTDLGVRPDRKSTRLNSSHANISYAVFCLKKKKKSTQSMRSTLPIQRDSLP